MFSPGGVKIDRQVDGPGLVGGLGRRLDEPSKPGHVEVGHNRGGDLQLVVGAHGALK